MIDQELDSELEEESEEAEPIPRLFTVTHGDISLLQMREGAIVNPSNTGLILGSGVSESIARRAGPDFQQKLHTARSRLYGNRLEPSRALATEPGGLVARNIIHVSIIGKKKVDTKLITNAILNVYDLAEEMGLQEIAFPALGVGLGKFPLEEFIELFFKITIEELPRSESLVHVVLCLYDEAEFSVGNDYIEANRDKVPEIITLDISRNTSWTGGLA